MKLFLKKIDANNNLDNFTISGKSTNSPPLIIYQMKSTCCIHNADDPMLAVSINANKVF